jgi:hypothetical protein
MGTNTGMAFSEFERFFRPHVRVLLAWRQLERLAPSTRFRILSTERDLRSLFCPWYVNGSGQTVGYGDPDARPLTVSAAAEIEWPLKRTVAVQQLAKAFRKGHVPVQVVLPAYAIDVRRDLLLDGNHRAVALVVARLRFRALIVAVEGPVNPEMLPDLAHFV